MWEEGMAARVFLKTKPCKRSRNVVRINHASPGRSALRVVYGEARMMMVAAGILVRERMGGVGGH